LARHKNYELPILVAMKAYKALFEAAKTFKEDPFAYDEIYFIAQRNLNWQDLGNASVAEIKDVVLWFLNKWKCRIPVTNEVAIRIKEAFKICAPFLNALKGERLQDIDFMDTKCINKTKMSNRQIIRFAFANFSSIGLRFSNVAASKTLHMINPELFVMWDNAIGSYYGLKLNPFSYAYKFMPFMKEKANLFIESIMKDLGCSRDAAVKGISSKCDGKTLAKLVDEYNWVKVHKG